ncbi:hypothetical protein ACN42_g7607 [Penicillium freii]|uniref:Uncharacterized protein n=1 Tax=Penicillium freii TaxID=48697 RepID=A0A101MFC3_PENFR|nr:hypothetical protein ACN42_g7607 [Penicillium freii]
MTRPHKRPTFLQDGKIGGRQIISHTIYNYRSLDYLSTMLRYSGLFGLVCNSPVQGQVITIYLSVIGRTFKSA